MTHANFILKINVCCSSWGFLLFLRKIDACGFVFFYVAFDVRRLFYFYVRCWEEVLMTTWGLGSTVIPR